MPLSTPSNRRRLFELLRHDNLSRDTCLRLAHAEKTADAQGQTLRWRRDALKSWTRSAD